MPRFFLPQFYGYICAALNNANVANVCEFAGEYPELFPDTDSYVETHVEATTVAVAGGAAGDAGDMPKGGVEGKEVTRGGGGRLGGGGGGHKSLLAMIGPHELVAKIEKLDGQVHRQIRQLCDKFFDGSIPAFPPNTREQFDAWSTVIAP